MKPAGSTLAAQQGLSLVELLVASALGLLVLAVGTNLLLASKAAYGSHDAHSRLQDTGRYALAVLSRAIQQAGYEDWGAEAGPQLQLPTSSASISGLDSHTLKAATAALEQPQAAAVQGSDVLALRFAGASDGSVLNCAGFAVPGSADPEHGRGWSIFFVGKDQTGEPELRCKYQGKSSWNAVPIARGVESFQVLYGLDSDGDGMPNRFLNATALRQLDAGLEGETAEGGLDLAAFNQATHWKKVVALKLALLIRSDFDLGRAHVPQRHALFGAEHAARHAALDEGTEVDASRLPAASRHRLRQVFSTIVYLRNADSGRGGAG